MKNLIDELRVWADCDARAGEPLGIRMREAADALAAKDATITRMAEALDQCEDYFDNRADAEYFTDSPTPVPNEEMTLLCVVRAALEAPR